MLKTLNIVVVFPFLLSFFFSHASFAISEKYFQFEYDHLVNPFYETIGSSGAFSGKDGVFIRYRKFEFPFEKGAIVISIGRGESYIQYAELAFDLWSHGYSIYILDHRGQGLSGRMLADSQVGYVHHFKDYVTDLKYFVDHVVKEKRHDKLFLLGHSMGGAIATLYASRHPNDFNALLLVSPMFEINTGNYPEFVAFSLASFQTTIGRGDVYAIGQEPFNGKLPFLDNPTTHSKHRFYKSQRLNNEHPETILGGASYRWVREAIRATWNIDDIAENMHLPILLLQAGQDSIVLPDRQNDFCEKASACQKISFSVARHNILQEQDSIRDLAIDAVLRFLNQR